MRHPVYLSFLGLVWLRPTMSLDRAVLLVVWTVYIFVGSVLKDRRMEFYLGDRYREYQARVVGYPGMLFGPLARVRQVAVATQPFSRPTAAVARAAKSPANPRG
jgi:methanethiol S-methyltransferase